MSIEFPTRASFQSDGGEYEPGQLTPLSLEFEKVKSEFGFIEPESAAAVRTSSIHAPGHVFDSHVASYIQQCAAEQMPLHHDLSDVYPHRGILISIAQLYHERQYIHPGNGPRDRARKYQYKEYVRTVFEDMQFLGETPSEHLDTLLYEFDIKSKNLPDLKVVRFNTNIMHVLARIDRNLTGLTYRSK